jgi:hypothetical protein
MVAPRVTRAAGKAKNDLSIVQRDIHHDARSPRAPSCGGSGRGEGGGGCIQCPHPLDIQDLDCRPRRLPVVVSAACIFNHFTLAFILPEQRRRHGFLPAGGGLCGAESAGCASGRDYTRRSGTT